MKAGAAQVVITPPVGVELAGWAFGPSAGILDHLKAQALYLENGEALVLVTADALGFGSDLVAGVRRWVKTGTSELLLPES